MWVSPAHTGRVCAKDILERRQSLAAELVAVADEQCLAQLARIGDPPEQVDGDECFSRAGCQGQEGAVLAFGDLLEHRPDGGILIVAPGRFPACVAGEKGLGCLGFQGETHSAFIRRAQLFRCGELAQRAGLTGGAGEVIVHHKQMPVRGKHKRDIYALTGSIDLALLQAMIRRQAFGFGFDQGNCHGLGIGGDFHTQGVIHPPV